MAIRKSSLAAIAVLLPLFGSGQSDKPPKASPADEFQALDGSFKQQRDEFTKAYQAAKSDAEREQAVKNFGERAAQQRFAVGFRQLVEKYPDDPVALRSLGWLLSYDPGGEEIARAVDSLGTDLLQSEQMATICQSLRYRPWPVGNKLLRTLLEKNRHRTVQGHARYSLAQSLQAEAERTGQVNPRAAALNEEAERLLKEVVEQFADVPDFGATLGKTAAAQLFELRNLAIGRTAPEIEGEDIDSKPFKLSDYRGKVVLLDFWGTW